MHLNEFNHYYFNSLVEKLANEQKLGVLLGDFNVDLLKYEQYKTTDKFFDSLSSSILILYIAQITINYVLLKDSH